MTTRHETQSRIYTQGTMQNQVYFTRKLYSPKSNQSLKSFHQLDPTELKRGTQKMKRVLVGSVLLIFISTTAYYLFPAISVPVFAEGFPGDGTFAVFWAELVFVAMGFLIFLFMNHMRTLVLLILIFGQMSLLLHNERAWLLGYEFPLYGIVAINGVIFLLLYFLFASHLWAPDELDIQDFDS